MISPQYLACLKLARVKLKRTKNQNQEKSRGEKYIYILKAPSGNKDMLPAKEGHACFLQ
jgi:hypothetical protein